MIHSILFFQKFFGSIRELSNVSADSQREKMIECPLPDLEVGERGVIVRIAQKGSLAGMKKFADIGLVPGAELTLEAIAPFGGLIRIRVLETSMAIHCKDARNIMIRKLD